MHRRSLNRFLLAATAFAAAGSLARMTDAKTGTRGTAGRFVVHEWGTFTTFQGSSGAVLEGLHHEEEPLPSFVHSVTDGQSGTVVTERAPDAAAPRREIEIRAVPGAAPAAPVATATPAPAPVIPLPPPNPRRGCGKGLRCQDAISHVTTKMETPVIYFHTDRPRSVRVHVDFEKGLLSQFYPSARLEGFRLGDVADLARIPRTSLDWRLDLVPEGSAAPTVPAVEKHDPWQIAREVKCASVIADGGEAERYVFYRGLGRLDLPISVEARGNGKVTVKNGGLDEIPAAFLLEMTPEGGRFSELGGIAAGESRASSFGDAPLASREKTVAALHDRVLAALIAEGLYEDEAIAMVKTWSRSWFGNEGTRLVYLVPRPLTDAVLPLSIDPKPPELVRVLVGRLEFLTPETEREAEEAFRDGFGVDAAKAEIARKRLDRFGRFQEPVARRIFATTRDPGARSAAARVIRQGGSDLF